MIIDATGRFSGFCIVLGASARLAERVREHVYSTVGARSSIQWRTPMTAKSSNPTTDQQDACWKEVEAEPAAKEALHELLQHRFTGPMIPAIKMGSRVEAMIERKRRVL